MSFNFSSNVFQIVIKYNNIIKVNDCKVFEVLGGRRVAKGMALIKLDRAM